MLSGSVMAILSMLVHQISEIRQKPTLLGSDPQNMSSCSTLDKIAIIEGMLALPILPKSLIASAKHFPLVKHIQCLESQNGVAIPVPYFLRLVPASHIG